AYESQILGERGKYHGAGISQRGWRRLPVVAIDEPRHSSIARYEGCAFGWLQSSPREPWKMAHLEIPSLPMQQFEMIVPAQNKFPALLAKGFDLFFLCYLAS